MFKKSLWAIGWLSLAVTAGLFAGQNSVVQATADSAPFLTNLVFDADTKQYDAKPTDRSAPFSFNLTNVWTNELTIDRVQTSCGCTVASLPSNPWHLAPGAHGEVTAKLDLTGKPPGLVSKTVTFYVSTNGVAAGTRVATVKASIPDRRPDNPAPMSEAERKPAMEIAKADPQEIFKNAKCAECHVNQGLHLQGKELYVADCGICHDSPNRASSVPDLHKLKLPQGFEYWKRLINDGKPHSMMPAFGVRQGGPIGDSQVGSLAAYLSSTFLSAPPPEQPVPPAPGQ